MVYKNKIFGLGVNRRNYQKNDIELDPLNLLDLQKKEFQKFLDEGIEEIFKEIFPVVSNKGKLKVDFLGLKLKLPKNIEEEIKYSKNKGSNFSFEIWANFRMLNVKEGLKLEEKEIFVANFPMMTEGGSFIINGSERTVNSQLIRAPGIYFENLKASKIQNNSDSSIFKISTIIPNRGSWIEFDYKDYKLLNSEPGEIKLKIDKSKRFNVFILLKAFGLKNQEIFDLYSQHELIKSTFEKIKDKYNEEENEGLAFEARKNIFKNLYSGDRFAEKYINESLTNLFFYRKRYDLSKTGRYKVNKKMSPYFRILNRTLFSDLLDSNNNVIFKKDTKIDNEKALKIQEYWEKNELKFTDYNISEELFNENLNLDEKDKKIFSQVHSIEIYDKELKHKENIICVPKNDFLSLTISDLIATVGYMVNLEQGMHNYDDIDSLSNRKIKSINELLKNQLRIGLTKIEKNLKERISFKDTNNITIKNSTNYKLLESVLKEFFNSSQLSQFMDQVNPLSEISNKRKITSLGPGGLSRDTASLVVRGIHDTHYGRIDPIETPEGPNIGLILNLAIYSRINEYGLLETPFFKVKNGIIDDTKPIFYDVDSEMGEVITSLNVEIKDKKIINDHVVARKNNSFLTVPTKEVTLINVSSKQIVSIATAHIPFLENNDANRALMGANMQRQSVPLIKAESPIIGTGIEEVSGKNSPTILKSKVDGEVIFVDSKKIIIKDDVSKKEITYNLKKFLRSNQATLINQSPEVKVGDKVVKEQIISNGPSIEKGEMSIGKNVVVAFTTWRGYNYEDAIIISERLVEDDVFTSIHIEEHRTEQKITRLGEEKITSDLPNVSKESMRNLDSTGIILIGSKVKVGDILVGKVIPKGEDDLSAEEKLLDAILGNKNKNVKDASLRVPYGADGIVHDIKILSKENGDKLDDGVEKIVKVSIAQKRKIKIGDKMSGRHGNKGVISKILPIEDMPYLEDGTKVDVMLNPLGVPSRMNIGQVLEVHMGMAAKKLGVKVSTPIFNGASSKDISEILKEANLSESGKFKLIDGITGEDFDYDVTVGVMYMLKLSHMIDDKMHARSIGPYSLITQQPLRGKSQNGGQRFGEMEAWALEGYGASNILQEMITLKSDDIKGRNELYNSIAKGLKIPKPNIPEGFWVLYYELRGLGLKLSFLNKEMKEVKIDNTI